MAQDRSFKNYIANRFYNELFAAVSGFLEEHRRDINISSRTVGRIDQAELSDIEVRGIDIDDLPGMRISFDVILEAEFEVTETDRHTDRADQKQEWFKITCTGDLSCNLNDFEISGIEVYSSRGKPLNPMTDSLVPIMRKNQLEQAAEDFLAKYYSEALDRPMPIDPFVLTEKMGLSVQMRHITPELTIFGEIFFVDCEAECYDKEQESMQKIPVQTGTIFVDPDAYYLLNLGSVNNTIVHECVHWARHRKAFELERLYNEDATQIKCLVVGGVKDNGAWTAADWMEWQANALAPRILMPFAQAKIKASELVEKYTRRFPKYELIDIMEPVIEEMAKFFNVSRLSAKIRMVELGYEEAVGTFTYIDGRYVRPHSFTKGLIQKNQTFSVSERDAIIESFMNADLRDKVQSGKYLFVDAHFCINAAKYITSDHKGRPCLTKYARHHMDECCLLFDLSVQKSANAYGQAYYGECVLFRGAMPEIVFEAHYSDASINDDVEARAKAITAYNKELAEVLQNLPGSFSGALKALMVWKDVTVEALAEACGLAPKTIQRMRNNEDYPTAIEKIVAVCIGLQLPPFASEALILRSAYSLGFSEKHLTYKFLLSSCYTKTIFECNEILQRLGLKPLTNEL